jgi:hypothetical protein
VVTDKKAFIAYCGLFCEECPGYKGIIADLARDLRKELRKAKAGEIAESITATTAFTELKYYQKYYDLLGFFVKFRCKKICQEGGGPPSCRIRTCCQEKDINGCWQCKEFMTCEKLMILKPGHGDAHIKNLRKLKRKGPAEFIQGKKYWYSAIKK